MEGIWGIVTIVGPILLGATLLWAIIRNRQQSSSASKAHTEQATRKLYDESGRQDEAKG